MGACKNAVRSAIVAAGLASGVIGLSASPSEALTGYRVAYTEGYGLNVRSGPTTADGIVANLPDGTELDLSCYTQGTNVNGANAIWYQLASPTSGGYAYGGYVDSQADPISGVPACSSAPAPTPDRGSQAVTWGESQIGSTANEGWCERFVWQAFGSSGRTFPSARAHWDAAVASGSAHPGDLNVPRGSIVFWDIAQPYGHVGISRGDGTFVATSVNGMVGTAALPYYTNYLGWAPAQY